MKGLHLLALLLSALLLSCNPKEAATDNAFSIGTRDSVFSKVLNEQRKILVHIPPSAENAGAEKYPVLYLLDGDAHFASVAGLVDQLSAVNGNTKLPEMIVVAIPNTDRTRDLTTSHVDILNGDTVFVKTSGGGENFATFIADELVPYIESKYPASTHRTLVGHSFGGLFAMHVAMKRTDLFSNYLVIDPSLWWDGRKLLNESIEILKTQTFKNKSLFVSVANTMRPGMTLDQLANDTTEATNHIRSILVFCEHLKNNPVPGLRFESRYYNGDDHSSVPLISTHDGLRSFFKWNEMPDMSAYFDEEKDSSASSLVNALNNHWKNVSERLGYEVKPSKQTVKEYAYYFQSVNVNDKSEAMFRMNTDNYPQDLETHEALGDFYAHVKDTSNAISAYEKALTVEEKEAIRKKIKTLKKG